MFGADIYYHSNCFSRYILKFKKAVNPSSPANEEPTGKRAVFQKYIGFIEEIINRGNGVTLTKIREMINTNEDINIKNNEVKIFLEENFGNRIQFCESDKKNKSLMSFSSSLELGK